MVETVDVCSVSDAEPKECSDFTDRKMQILHRLFGKSIPTLDARRAPSWQDLVHQLKVRTKDHTDYSVREEF